MSRESIRITGARQHNLKNLTLEIPRNQLVVITGPSGSGKSSLAFNTLYAEGQRRYVESLSAYARQFLDQMEKPDVDFVEGLSPAIAIEQRSSAPNPRSTIATSTEIYDYLRVLYAALGRPHDPVTGKELTRHTPTEIVDGIAALPEGTRVVILAPLVADERGEFRDVLEKLRREGFVRARVDGEIRELDDGDAKNPKPLRLKRTTRHSIEAVVDRIIVKPDLEARIADSIETALKWSRSQVWVLAQVPASEPDAWELRKFSTTFTNPETGFALPELTPKHFSFNGHLGACERCHGLGSTLVCDPALLVPDPKKSIAGGAVKSWHSRRKRLLQLHQLQVEAVARHFGASLEMPFSSLPAAFKQALFDGTGQTPIKTGWKTGPNKRSVEKPFEGLLALAERLYETSKSDATRRNVRRFMNPLPCPACRGARLKPAILAVSLPHPSDEDLNIHAFSSFTVQRARTWLSGIALSGRDQTIAGDVLREILARLSFLEEVGLGYLTLNRESATLSGGEAQRIRLATQLGSALAGVLYVLDEPSIGLHPRDIARLLGTLRRLRDLGNSVIVVEHDADTIRSADHILDLGPQAGTRGGEIIAQGTLEDILLSASSSTGKYLSGALSIQVPKKRKAPTRAAQSALELDTGSPDFLDTGWLTMHGAEANNLQSVEAAFPVGCITCVTGVSGSGKSTLVDTILRRALFRHFYRAKDAPGRHQAISGLQQIDKAIVVDQSPIGRSPRSNPATYSGAFGPIREMFAKLPLSKVRGYAAGRFSFNTPGGRCEACKGDGSIRIDMHFLSDVFVTCEKCAGRRYNRETLDVTFKGRNIADILDMSVDQAIRFFSAIPPIQEKLLPMNEIGLGYLKLGQSATTLSGGEAQRIKLAAELAKRSTGRTLYLLDEPTTGLHFSDIETLLHALFRLREAGNTLIVIEHNLDVIKCADWILDLGPGGGTEGGRIVAQGAPEHVAAVPESHTGRFLKPLLPKPYQAAS